MDLWNKIVWGGNPDEFNDVTGLSRRDVHYIKKSWKVMYAESEKYGHQLFLGIFRRDPATKKLFKIIQDLDEEGIIKNTKFTAHVIHVMASIDMAVTNIDQPEIVIVLMNKIGVTHNKFRVQEEHFNELKIVFVEILKKELQAKDDQIASWARFISFINKHLLTLRAN